MVNSLIGRLTQEKYDAYKTFSHADEDGVNGAVTPGQGPECKAKRMPGKCGSFNPMDPESLSINQSVLRNFEADKITCEQLSATVEHELAHYLYNDAFGQEPTTKEMGNEYETYVNGAPTMCTPPGEDFPM